MLAWGGLSELPLSTLDDESIPADVLADLVSDSTRDLVYLVELYLFQRVGVNTSGDLPAMSELPLSTLQEADEALTGIVMFRFSDRKFVTSAADDPASTIYDARLSQPLFYRRSLGRGDGLMAYGGVAQASAEVVLANLDGALDTMLTSYAVDGRRVAVKVGARGAAYSAFQTIFDGTAERWDYDDAQVTIRLRSALHQLRLPALGGLRYDGSGGLEGGADLKGKGKPLCYGEALNVAPPLVDATNKKYQPHGGGLVEDITAVYERGFALTLTTDYTLDLANGVVDLVGSPAGLITCDVRGDESSGSYVTTAADIARRFLIDRCGYEAAGLDIGTFDQAAGDQPAPVNLYIADDSETRESALIRLLQPLGMFLTDTRDGKVAIARFGSDPGFDRLDLVQAAARDDFLQSIERSAPPLDPPARAVRVAFQRNWTVQTTDLSGSVTDARRQFLAEADRLTDPLDTGAGSAHALADDPPPVPALFVDEADAGDEAARLAALHGVDRSVYRVRTPVGLWRCRLGQQVCMTYPRWDLASGKTGWIVSLSEDAARNEVEMEILA